MTGKRSGFRRIGFVACGLSGLGRSFFFRRGGPSGSGLDQHQDGSNRLNKQHSFGYRHSRQQESEHLLRPIHARIDAQTKTKMAASFS